MDLQTQVGLLSEQQEQLHPGSLKIQLNQDLIAPQNELTIVHKEQEQKSINKSIIICESSIIQSDKLQNQLNPSIGLNRQINDPILPTFIQYNQSSVKNPQNKQQSDIKLMENEYCKLIFSATLQRFFTCFAFASMLNIEPEKTDYDNWSLLLQYVCLFPIIGLMPHLIRKYMPRYKNFFFYSTLLSTLVVFLPIYIIFFKSQDWPKLAKLIVYRVLDLITSALYCQIVLFVNGYLFNLLNTSKGKNLGLYIIQFTFCFQIPRLIRYVQEILQSIYGYKLLLYYSIFVTICTIIGLVMAYFVKPFQLIQISQQQSQSNGKFNTNQKIPNHENDQFQQFKSQSINKIKKLPRMFSILKERQFWPVLAAPFTQSFLIGFFQDSTNRSFESKPISFQKQIATYNAIYYISMFLLTIPAGIISEKLIKCNSQSIKQNQIRQQNQQIESLDKEVTATIEQLKIKKNKYFTAINIDFIFILCLIIQLVLTTSLINLETVVRQNIHQTNNLTLAKYYIISGLGGANAGVLWVVSLQIGIRRCCGELEIFAWANKGFYLSYMIIEFLPVVWSLEVFYVVQIVILIFYQLFANTSGYRKFQLMDINGQTAFEEEINKDQFCTRYKIIRQLVKPTRDGLVVALYKDRYKRCEVVVKSMFTNNAWLAAHAKDELKTLITLQSYPNIIQLQQFVCVTEQPNAHQIIMIMQKATNTLDEQIKQSNNVYFPLGVVQKNLKAIIFTLGKISKEKNIAHRDIKPGNIFVIQDDWLLGDFGEAYWHHAHLKAVQQEQSSMQRQGQQNEVEELKEQIQDYIEELTVGTPCYMSPQLWLNNQAIASEELQVVPYPNINFYKSDMFSLGLTFLEAVTLKSCYNFNNDKNRHKLNSRLEETKNLYEGIFYQILCLMLQWDEDNRPSFEELMDQINQNQIL